MHSTRHWAASCHHLLQQQQQLRHPCHRLQHCCTELRGARNLNISCYGGGLPAWDVLPWFTVAELDLFLHPCWPARV